MKRVLTVLFFGVVFTTICAAQTPNTNFRDFTESGPATQNNGSDDLVASHARLPRGTMVQVTNEDTGAQVVVEITGRIPPSGSRIIDLSAGASLQLGLDPDEIPQVTIAVVDEDALEAEAPAPAVVDIPAPVFEPDPIISFDDGEPLVFNYDDIYGGEPIVVYDDVVETPAPVVVAPPPPPAPEPAPPPAPPPEQVTYPSDTTAAPAPVYAPPAPAYPVYTPPPRAPVYTPPVPAAPVPYYYPEPVQPAYTPPIAPAAKIIPRMPESGSLKVYRVQVGAFRAARNAKDVFDRLASAGFSPAFETYGDLYRVVISGIRAQDVPTVAQRLGNAGFVEAWIREEL
jgi:hypothetical protein